jgi:AcrR family transcriptional regulator
MIKPVTAVLPGPASLPPGQQARRRRIVDAAIDLLRAGEYEAVQMRDVAERAGVALATIYRYFTSKEHLYAAALLEWSADYPTRGRAGRPSGETPEERLRALMRRAVRAFERYPQMMRAEIVLESSQDPNARALFEQFASQNTSALLEALDGIPADDASAVVDVVNAVLATRLRSWALGRCSIRDVDRAIQRAIDVVFSPRPSR